METTRVKVAYDMASFSSAVTGFLENNFYGDCLAAVGAAV